MKVNALKGMKDILPAEQKLRDYVQSKILETYRASGFERISTPMLEDAENLDKSDGGDNLNLIFKVLKRGEKLEAALNAQTVEEKSLSDMGLRYDLTLPLSRFFAANKNELQFPFKVIQTDRVFRAERPQKGRSREFVQCDIDILGDTSANAEVELIDVTARALLNIGCTDERFKNFTININDRRILRNMLETMGFAAESLDSVCITFDKLDKIGAEGVEAELKEKAFPENAIKALVDFISKDSEITLDDVASKCADASIADDLKYIISTVNKISNNKYKISYTPNLVRGQGYYTGVVFEIASPAFSGAVGGGGRYDNMIGKFLGQQVPAVGFSIGFERICSILLDIGFKIPDEKEKCALLYDESTEFPEVIAAAEKLRSDYSVSILHKAKKMGPMFDMLEKQGYTKFASFKDGELNIK
ncbi:MAG: histidine--tRNA ligase [Treponema sp.]|nr:histidine--tRNA ligase [Treponema sp.]